MYKLGIVGRGFVGSAVAQGFSQGVGYNAEIRIYDKDPLKSNDSLEDIVKLSEIIFISVPTPSNKDGSINLDILEGCLEEINEIANKTNSFDNIYLIRSTVTPGTTRNFQEKFPNLRFVFNPEFLTERSANFDFISQTRFVLGGDQDNVKKISSLYRDRFGSTVSIIETDYESAELIKYVCNTFFATKVSFLNEMKLLSESVNANWQDVMEGFLRDGRVGNSHSQVPGPDGKLGFGGSCFPKDIQALINFGTERNINLSVLKGAWETNKLVRPEKDWESLVGRAVVDNKIEE
jgi:UDPglucose 6-dehydrogenase|tara:strand:+ start:4415 stop:5290 length:876 start_codon:yes stop_codon:yes gene_type:complete